MSGRLGLVIGRFQPFHRGHEALCRTALADCDRLLIVLGSGRQARDTTNPWTDEERRWLIEQSLPDVADRLRFAVVPDIFYNEAVWLTLVRRAVQAEAGGDPVTLYGHTKDSSSYYLKLFPEWRYTEVPLYHDLSATPLREALLAAGPDAAPARLEAMQAEIAPPARAALARFLAEPAFAEMAAEFAWIQRHREAWAGAPYPPIFVTVDALVECAGQVLLVRRGRRPGRGLWALPGGYLDVVERLQAGVRRELAEETGLNLADRDHEFVASRAYDAPERSARGRIITHLFHYRLPADQPPAVGGADDAAEAAWWRPEDLDPTRLFEDHYCILQHALDYYPEVSR